jgi:DNA-binding response OmpR family regulator
MNRVLVVESDNSVSERLYRYLSDIEVEVTSCATIESATAMLEMQIFNVAVIDVELADGDGYDLIYEIELGIYYSKDIQVIAIMPKGEVPDHVDIIERGITDYITKPFSTAVLKSKILTIFARQKRRHALMSGIRANADSLDNIVHIETARQKIVIDNYMFDFEDEEFSVGGRRLRLDEVQQVLLRMLIHNRGMVLGKYALVDRLRTQCNVAFIDASVLTEIIGELTTMLCAQDYIKTVYGIGYMWIKREDNNATF